jgi:hypothetical protein
MKYFITRTSGYHNESILPHPRAVEAQAYYWDCRTLKSFDELKTTSWGKDFFKKGINHREHGNFISRLLPRDGFTIEIEDLVQFTKEEGPIILKQSGFDEIPLEIEIYDDYRE